MLLDLSNSLNFLYNSTGKLIFPPIRHVYSIFIVLSFTSCLSFRTGPRQKKITSLEGASWSPTSLSVEQRTLHVFNVVDEVHLLSRESRSFHFSMFCSLIRLWCKLRMDFYVVRRTLGRKTKEGTTNYGTVWGLIVVYVIVRIYIYQLCACVHYEQRSKLIVDTVQQRKYYSRVTYYPRASSHSTSIRLLENDSEDERHRKSRRRQIGFDVLLGFVSIMVLRENGFRWCIEERLSIGQKNVLLRLPCVAVALDCKCTILPNSSVRSSSLVGQRNRYSTFD